jgi:hypothetical protein
LGQHRSKSRESSTGRIVDRKTRQSSADQIVDIVEKRLSGVLVSLAETALEASHDRKLLHTSLPYAGRSIPSVVKSSAWATF